MSAPVRLVLGALLVLILGWMAWRPIKSGYVERRAEVMADITKAEKELDRYRAGREDHTIVRAKLNAYADRTLGGDRETVDHRLRSRLNRLGEEIGLANLSVGTGPVRQLPTPARSQFNRRTHGELREEIDFVEVDAWISGMGSLEQVMRLAHRVEGEPWLKRINQVRLQPRDNGTEFGVMIRLTTLFMPGREPAEMPFADDVPGYERLEPLVARNPFRVPPPEAPKPPQEVVASAPPPKPGFPYHQWVITGIVAGPHGPEVWLLNRETKMSRTLAVGQSLEDLVLESAEGELASFRLGDEQFAVAMGAGLTDRRPLDQGHGPQ